MKAYEATLTIDGKLMAAETGPIIEFIMDHIRVYLGAYIVDADKKPKEIDIKVKEI